MAKTKIREVTIAESKGTFGLFRKSAVAKSDFDFGGLSSLRNLLTNEKARMLHVIKNKNPKSIYELAKILGRTFKSVSDDLKLLERFGFIEFLEEKTKKRIRHRPIVIVDTVIVNIKV